MRLVSICLKEVDKDKPALPGVTIETHRSRMMQKLDIHRLPTL